MVLFQDTVRPYFKFTTSDYAKILKTAGVVDKTMLIKDVIEHQDVVMITAPPKFGKSTNLDMIKKFMEIEVKPDGTPKAKSNLTVEPVAGTKNHKLFMKYKLKITENESLMREHFGNTPVLSVSFKCFNVVKTYDEAVSFCKEVAHNSYRQNKYLLHSNRLTSSQKHHFEKWFNETTFMNQSVNKVAHALRMLSVYLYRHFDKRRVFVLIDDHDSIVESAMFDVKGAEVLRKIIALSVSMMSTVVKNNDIYVKGALITGVSDIPVFGFSDLDNMNTYRFLEEHLFQKYYGLTKPEADELLGRPEFHLDPKAVKEAHLAYNGYQTVTGQKVYNIYSLMRFLKMGVVKNYWTKFVTIKKLKNVFKVPAFKPYVEKLAEGKTISIVILEKLTVEDIIDLRSLLHQPHSQINYWPATLFNYLLKQGYLTYMPSSHHAVGVSVKKSTVKLPNTEVINYINKLK